MSGIKEFLKKDNLAFGLVLAFAISVAIYASLWGLAQVFQEAFSSHYLRKQVLAMISIFANLFPFRFYMLKLKLDKTGRGVLAAMFVMTILYFLFIHGGQE
ncbi:MAG: hypothetical protein IH597_00155 [Bacteroidales bacterium]|nr:hypothetical protein [Bacteroidales bacterium]